MSIGDGLRSAGKSIAAGIVKGRERREKLERFSKVKSAIEKLESGEYEGVLDSFDNLEDLVYMIS